MQTISTINFNTANQTLRQLLGNGLIYRVPRFQRDYSWTEEEWEDLWQDILSILPAGDEPAHYMGYLVLQTLDNRLFEVIDGQQRITTLSILILAILNNIQHLIENDIDRENNQRRLEQLRNSYIGFLDPVTLVPTSKLTLNRNDDLYYQSYLVPLEKLPMRNLKASERLLRKAFEWFNERVRAYISETEGAKYAQLINDFADKLFFTVITVSDELNAFKVFETLNSRGVRLSSTDLLKNYLFSIISHTDGQSEIHENEINTLEQKWQRIIDRLGSEKFPTFLRVHWNSRHNLVRHTEIFKTLRKSIQNKGDAFELLRDLDTDVEIYAALSQPQDSLWNAEPEQRKALEELRLFNVRQLYPLLLAAKRELPNKDFTIVLRACTVITFRYNTISGLSPNEQERVYNAAAREIAAGNLTGVQAVLNALRPIYISDERFRNSFGEKEIRTTASRNRRLVRYILFKLEQHVTNTEYDFESKNYTIEHILPENAEEEWAHFIALEQEQFVYRLGNMTLLQARSNRALGNQSFDEKQTVFGESEFEITRRVEQENKEWTPQRVAQHQRWMAKQATAIWRIPQLA